MADSVRKSEDIQDKSVAPHSDKEDSNVTELKGEEISEIASKMSQNDEGQLIEGEKPKVVPEEEVSRGESIPSSSAFLYVCSEVPGGSQDVQPSPTEEKNQNKLPDIEIIIEHQDQTSPFVEKLTILDVTIGQESSGVSNDLMDQNQYNEKAPPSSSLLSDKHLMPVTITQRRPSREVRIPPEILNITYKDVLRSADDLKAPPPTPTTPFEQPTVKDIITNWEQKLKQKEEYENEKQLVEENQQSVTSKLTQKFENSIKGKYISITPQTAEHDPVKTMSLDILSSIQTPTDGKKSQETLANPSNNQQFTHEQVEHDNDYVASLVDSSLIKKSNLAMKGKDTKFTIIENVSGDDDITRDSSDLCIFVLWVFLQTTIILLVIFTIYFNLDII